MAAIQLVQILFLRPLLSSLRDTGVPVKRYLDSSGLSRFNLAKGNNYVPAHYVSIFIEEISQHETGPDIPCEILRNYRMSQLGDWGTYITSIDTLHEACLAALRPEAYNLSFESISLDIRGSEVKLEERIYSVGGVSDRWIQMAACHLMLDGVQQYKGKNWFPTKFSVPWKDIGAFEELIPSKGVDVRLNHDGISFQFPSKHLVSRIGSGSYSPKNVSIPSFDILDLSRFSSGYLSHSGCQSFECERTFTAQR